MMMDDAIFGNWEWNKCQLIPCGPYSYELQMLKNLSAGCTVSFVMMAMADGR